MNQPPHQPFDLEETYRCYRADDQIRLLAAGLDHAVGPEWIARFPQTGILLAAAVADELDGRVGAVDSLRPWLTDATRFPAERIAAVQATLIHARQQAVARSTPARITP